MFMSSNDNGANYESVFEVILLCVQGVSVIQICMASLSHYIELHDFQLYFVRTIPYLGLLYGTPV
jgi:hypothetical protein